MQMRKCAKLYFLQLRSFFSEETPILGETKFSGNFLGDFGRYDISCLSVRSLTQFLELSFSVSKKATQLTQKL